MSTGIPDAGKVLVAPRRPRSSVIFGEETILAPKARLEFSIDENNENPARLAAVRASVAESNARRVLQGIATENAKRTVRFPNSPGVWVQAGLAHITQGDYSAARTAFGRAIALDPKSRSARLGLARVANETGQGIEALSILRQLESENPSDLEVVVSLAVVLADVEGIEVALKTLEREPTVEDRSAPFFAARGSLRVAMRNYDAAISDLRKVVRLKPDWVQARNVLGIAELKAGHLWVAERRFRESVRIAPMYLEGFLNLLRVMMLQKRYRDAMDLALEQFPDIPAAPAPVGTIASQAAMELEEWMTARSWLQSALGKAEDKPLRARLLNDLGVTFGRTGRHTDAEKRFADSVAAFPTELGIVNRAKALLYSRMPLEAAAWLEDAPQTEEASGARRAVQAVALSQAKYHEEAVAVYESLIHDGLADPIVFRSLAAEYTDGLHNLERAVEIARLGLKQFPDDGMLLNNLAYALLMGGEVDSAAEVLDRDIKLEDAELVYLTATRGLLELKRGNIGLGRKLYDEALALSQTDATRERVRVKRDLEVARSLLKEGKNSEALSLLKRASEAGDAAYPYHEDAKAELSRLRAGEHPRLHS